jgi:hypothetical protein
MVGTTAASASRNGYLPSTVASGASALKTGHGWRSEREMSDESLGVRWLSLDAAAAYISVRPAAMSRLVREGKIPAPNRSLGERSPRWDRLALDSVFEGGATSTDIRQVVEAGLEKIRARGVRRKKRSTGV